MLWTQARFRYVLTLVTMGGTLCPADSFVCCGSIRDLEKVKFSNIYHYYLANIDLKLLGDKNYKIKTIEKIQD